MGQTFVFKKIAPKLRHFNSDTLLSNLVYFAKERHTSQEFFSSDRKIKNSWKKSNFLVNKQQTDWFPTLIENQQRWRIWLLTRHRPEVAFVFLLPSSYMYSEYVFVHCHVGKRYSVSYIPGPISLIEQIWCLNLMWLLMLYAPIRPFNMGLHNYKIEKQNKQIKTFQVVLLTRLSVVGAGCVCVWGGSAYFLDNLPVCSMMICFIKWPVNPVKHCLNWISQTFHVKPVHREGIGCPLLPAGQVISSPCSFFITELTPLILASKSEFSQGSHSLYKVI